MTANGWIQILFFFARDPRGDAAARRLPAPRARGRAPLPAAARSAGSSGSSTALGGVDGREQSWQTLRARRCWPSAPSRCSSPTPSSGCSTCCPSTRRGSARSRPRSAFNTAASFTTNTNWQGYAGEATMSYLTPDGRPRLAQLHLRRGRASRSRWRSRAASPAAATGKGPGTIGNFWVDLTRATVYILLPICVRLRARLRLAGDDPEPRARTRRSRRSRARKQVDRDGAGGLAGGDQAARHERRRLLQRERRPPVREPDPAHQLPLDVPDLRDPGRR